MDSAKLSIEFAPVLLQHLAKQNEEPDPATVKEGMDFVRALIEHLPWQPWDPEAEAAAEEEAQAEQGVAALKTALTQPTSLHYDLLEQFRKFDTNDSGFLEKHELERILSMFLKGSDIDETALKRIIERNLEKEPGKGNLKIIDEQRLS